jgi:hypothetical protein
MLAVLAAACGGSGDDDTAADSTLVRDPAAQALPDPDLPPVARGRLALRSTGPIAFAGQWDAQAGLCAEPPMLQVVVQEQLDGLILLLLLPAEGSRTVAYPVTRVDEGRPGPVAQVGVQRIIEGRPASWLAEDGAVELHAWEGRRLSGRFRLTMRDINSSEPSRVAGAFFSIAVVDLPPEYCTASDSTI